MADDVVIFDRLLEIALLLQEDLASALAGTGLTPARTHLLWVLHHAGPSTQQAIAAALQVSARNVTGLVDALEDSGHVRRGPHPGDRRATLVTLTDLGAETMAGMVRDRAAAAAALLEGLDDDRRVRLRSDLEALTERLRGMIAAAGR